jgi:hypothetical protein
MRAALRHQLQTHGERPIFRIGNLSVDLVRRIVKVGANDIKLSPKEYDLLRVLVQHAGKVLTHKFLLGELWDGATMLNTFVSTSGSCGRRSKPTPNGLNTFSPKPGLVIGCALQIENAELLQNPLASPP